jgi:hypothetical protein
MSSDRFAAKAGMKHGDDPRCGYNYKVDEATLTAYCPHCGEGFPKTLPGWPRGQIVRYTSKALKNTFGQGGRGAPVNGRIVGSADHWPIVQWSNGNVSPISETAIEKKK